MNDGFKISYWEQTSILRKADICIIGAGLTGLQTAIALRARHPRARIVLLERAPFTRGASTRNAGFACFGSPTELMEDLSDQPATQVWDTVARRYAGIKRLAKTYGTAINYEQHGGYELYDRPAIFAQVAATLPDLNQELYQITGKEQVFNKVEATPGVKSNYQLIFNALEGQIHPGKLVELLIKRCQDAGVQILFGISVNALEESKSHVDLILDNGKLRSSRVVLTTNAFSKTLIPELPIVPARNQVIISEPIPGLQLRGCFHFERGYVYLRNVGADRILIGGARHLAKMVEETDHFGTNSDLIAALANYVNQWLVFPPGQTFKIAGSWSGIIAQGDAKSPIVKQYSERVVVAVRLAGMGVALSAQVATEAAELVG